MPHPKAWRLPEPENDEDFEVLCVDLYAAWKKPKIAPERFGRSGQKQHGLDFVLDLDDGLHGYQCKCTRTLDLAVVEEELAKTASFPAPLSTFGVLTTAPRNARLQEQVYALSQARRRRGEFPVGIMFWESICDRLAEHIEVLKHHFAHIVPDLDDLLQARARRLDDEFPGTTVSYHSAPGRTTVTVHPGPDGVPMKATLFGKEVFERFEESMDTGKSATFTDEEFSLVLPEAIEQVLGRRVLGEGRRGTVTITPSVNGSEERARLLIQPLSAHHTVQIFDRKGRRSPEGLPATLTIIQGGIKRIRVHVAVDGMPLAVIIENDGSSRGTFHIDGSYLGQPVGVALAAERHLQLLTAGAYVGVYAQTIHFAFRSDPRSTTNGPLEMLEGLDELAELTDWEINVPDVVDAEDARTCTELTELFTHGRRLAGRGGKAHIRIETDEQLKKFRDLLASDTKAISSTIVENERDITVFGQTFRLPSIRTTVARVEISESDSLRIMATTELPMEIDVLIPDDVDLIQEIA